MNKQQKRKREQVHNINGDAKKKNLDLNLYKVGY